MLSIAAVYNTAPDCAAQPQTALCVVECFGLPDCEIRQLVSIRSCYP